MENWKKVSDFINYSISDKGRLRNDKTGRILKGGLDKDGYPQAILCNKKIRKCFKIHKLVARAFIPNIDNKPQVNHKDGNKQNNAANNLEWVTMQENQSHFWRELNNDVNKENRRRSHIGKGLLSDNPHARAVIRLDDGKIFKTIKEAAEDIGVNYTHIGEVCRGARKTCGGFRWSYLKEVI